MQIERFTVKNVKCGGCVANIENGLKEMPGVTDVTVVIAGGEVSVTGDGLNRADIAARLKELGYPEA
jgi:copper chaperone